MCSGGSKGVAETSERHAHAFIIVPRRVAFDLSHRSTIKIFNPHSPVHPRPSRPRKIECKCLRRSFQLATGNEDAFEILREYYRTSFGENCNSVVKWQFVIPLVEKNKRDENGRREVHDSVADWISNFYYLRNNCGLVGYEMYYANERNNGFFLSFSRGFHSFISLHWVSPTLRTRAPWNRADFPAASSWQYL